jgi:EutQ-like cupin domain
MATTTGTQIGKQSFASADEVRTFDHGKLEVVNVAGHAVGRATFEPGWRWSTSVKPIAQTELCEAEHLGCVLSGTMHVVMKDGAEMDFTAGDAMYLAPGHDAWIVGSEPCVALDFVGFRDYAKPK